MTLTPAQKRYAIKTARKFLSQKLKLEKPFTRELKSYFFQQYKKVRAGRFPDSIAPVLDVQYARIVREMTGIRMKQEEDDFGLEDALMLILFNRAITQAQYIDRTTKNNIEKARKQAIQQLQEEGLIFPSETAIRKTQANIFRRLNSSRPANIATTETQMLFEKVKDTQEKIGDDMMNQAIVENDQALGRRAADMMQSRTAREVADDIGTVPASELFTALAVLMHTWVTMGDKKVRLIHNLANFQTVPRDQPFEVGGELLMYPGDTSLGASGKNINHCRCSEILL